MLGRNKLDRSEICDHGEPFGRTENLRLIALLVLCLFMSLSIGCTRSEPDVPFDESKPFAEGVCFNGQPIKWRFCLSLPSRYGGYNCETIGCSSKPESVSDVCQQLRSEYAATGRVQLGNLSVVRYNEDPTYSKHGSWWPTQRVGRLNPRYDCYEGIELETTSSRILESVRKRPMDDHVPTSKPSLVN